VKKSVVSLKALVSQSGNSSKATHLWPNNVTLNSTSQYLHAVGLAESEKYKHDQRSPNICDPKYAVTIILKNLSLFISSRDGYHPIQERLTQYNGSQCGFCTPGMVVNMYRLFV